MNMGSWWENSLFGRIKKGLIKWYRVTIAPIIHINNNPIQDNVDKMFEEARNQESAASYEDDYDDYPEDDENIEDEVSGENNAANIAIAGGNAQDVLDRINKDRSSAVNDEVEKARKKAEEEARLAAIMNANKVDVNSFIAEGKQKAEEESAKANEAEQAAYADEKSDAQKEEELRRAQEIIDRLNREAAEDEAKKQAEIDAAKKAAGVD